MEHPTVDGKLVKQVVDLSNQTNIPFEERDLGYYTNLANGIFGEELIQAYSDIANDEHYINSDIKDLVFRQTKKDIIETFDLIGINSEKSEFALLATNIDTYVQYYNVDMIVELPDSYDSFKHHFTNYNNNIEVANYVLCNDGSVYGALVTCGGEVAEVVYSRLDSNLSIDTNEIIDDIKSLGTITYKFSLSPSGVTKFVEKHENSVMVNLNTVGIEDSDPMTYLIVNEHQLAGEEVYSDESLTKLAGDETLGGESVN